MTIFLIVIAFLAGCATTWASMLNIGNSGYSSGYAQGYHDAITEKESENAK